MEPVRPPLRTPFGISSVDGRRGAVGGAVEWPMEIQKNNDPQGGRAGEATICKAAPQGAYDDGKTWGRLLPAALEEEGEDDLVEALGDVDGDVVDAVLHGALLEVGLLT